MDFFAATVVLIVSHAAMIAAFTTLAAVSKIFGMARQQKPRYGWFHMASALAAAALIPWLAGLERDGWSYLGAGLDLMATGLGCAAAVFYWSWLPGELAKEKAVGRQAPAQAAEKGVADGENIGG